MRIKSHRGLYFRGLADRKEQISSNVGLTDRPLFSQVGDLIQ